MKRVLVTGASGFIGRHCLDLLIKAGYEVHALFSKNSIELPVKVFWHKIDLLDPEAVSALLSSIKPTHLLHLAWYAEHGKFWRSPLNLNWVEATLRLLREFVRQGGVRFVGAGTCAEYEWTHAVYSEETPRKPSTLYGVCKAAVHEIAEAYCNEVGVRFAWGRVFHLYGPYEQRERFVPAVIQKLLQKETVPCSHGEQIRDFMHVADVASAFVALLESDIRGAVNIASGQGKKLKEISRMIGEKLGGVELIRLGALSSPPQDPPSLVANNQLLLQKTGWKPRYTLDEGLQKTIHWWRKQ